MKLTDEMIGRYIDNDLNETERAEFVSLMATNADIERRVNQLLTVTAQAEQLHREQLAQPVPEHLVRAIRTATPRTAGQTSTTPHRTDETGWGFAVKKWFGFPSNGLALASLAMLVTGLLIGISFQSTDKRPEFLAMEGAINAGSSFDARLNSAASGTRIEEGEYQLEFLASFMGEDGRFCREYQAERQGGSARIVIGIACRTTPNATWQVVFAVDEAFEQSPESEYYVTASDALLKAVDDYIRKQHQDTAAVARTRTGDP